MRTRTFIVPVGTPLEVAVQGDYVRVRQSTVTLFIENAENGDKIEVSQGDDFEFGDFKRLRISHNDAAEQTVKLTISKGKKAGSAQVGGSITVANPTVHQGAFTQGQTSVSNVVVQLLAANAARRYLMVQNNDASQVLRVVVNGTNPSATVGFRLQPGESLEFTNFCPTAAIKAIMESGTAAAGNVEFVEG